ncbi:hypothetical protein NR352_18865 [Enterobacter soli]|nr:hypothetical protein [Enterobacter soli]MCR1319016.1 hypothetical protein [Enterobacter soli]
MRLVAPPIAVIWNTWAGLVSAMTVQPLRMSEPAAVKFVPVPVAKQSRHRIAQIHFFTVIVLVCFEDIKRKTCCQR